MVFADIGTSQYYVPGILYGEIGRSAAGFVLLTGLCVLLLARKYVDITARYQDGGGVVSVTSDAFGSLMGAVGGMLITVDYFLTSAISAVSGFEYISTLVPLGSWKLALPCVALMALGALNVVGLKESAVFSAVMAVFALAVSLLTITLCAIQATPAQWQQMATDVTAMQHMEPMHLLHGFAGAWLAFSGLESMSHLSPALVEPKGRVAMVAMAGVTLSILITSPVLTALSLSMLDLAQTNPDHFISNLGMLAGGLPLRTLVVVSASTLLLFAANTAIIGGYQVFVVMARDRYLPAALSNINYRFGTPHQAIALAVFFPILIILATGGSLAFLGSLYAFGLLGAFTLSSLSLDVVAWRERRRGVWFFLGLVTTLLVALAWSVNLVFKLKSTLFGGGLLALGMGLAISVKRGWIRGETNLIPFLTAEAAESAAEQAPAMRKILSLQEAQDLLAVYPGALLLPVRGFRQPMMDAALTLARERGFNAIHLLFVDEVPGLFYPPKVGPSPEAIRTLARCTNYLVDRGVEALPIWRMAHDAPASIASAARRLATRVVMVGTSERNPLWTVLRGSVLRGLAEKLDPTTQLVVADTSKPAVTLAGGAASANVQTR
ncbi:MAG: universal stress protein [Myxococcota bacterium]